ICKIDAEGNVTTVAGHTHPGSKNVKGVANFELCLGIAIDRDGYIYVAEAYNHCIRRVCADGEVSTFAGRVPKGYADGSPRDSQFEFPTDIAIDSQGVMYITDSGNGCLRAICTNEQAERLKQEFAIGLPAKKIAGSRSRRTKRSKLTEPAFS